MSNLVKHAEIELKIAGLFDKDSDYDGALGNATLDLIKVFAKQGHSGMSASMVRNLFHKLANYKPLTPLTLKDDEWGECSTNNSYQNLRNSAVFKEGKEGKPYYINAYTMIKSDNGGSWSGSLLLKDNKRVKRCYPKDIKNMPTIKITPPLVQHSKEASDWDFLPVDESMLAELKKYYDVEIKEENSNASQR